MRFRILPQQIDNTYKGQKLALWLFGFVLLIKIVQSTVILINGGSVVKGADGIPLDTFSPDAAHTVVALFALTSLYRLIICLLGVIALVRYRGIITLMFAVLVIEYIVRQLILYFYPLGSIGAPPGPIVNFVLFLISVIGFALSLLNRRDIQD
ncbi:MAG TPA: hypothetical protein DCP92_20090 [Nitrospiraceae bacterium]|nr:hypothetical protein [Nitrospiraceae bacterium]